MSGARRWCPERWRDDEMPFGETPDAFLHQFGPYWYLTDPADPPGARWNDPIYPGEVVAFSYRETRGRFVIHVFKGDAYGFPDDMPQGPGIEYWVPGEPATLSDDLDHLVTGLPRGSNWIEAVYWSERPVLFRFELVGETAHFVEVPS